jgi:hypothetical protein
MKKTLFECDVCKTQDQSIFEAKITINKIIIGNGERDHTVPPIDFSIQTCGLDCLQKAIASKAGHALAKIEKKEEESDAKIN